MYEHLNKSVNHPSGLVLPSLKGLYINNNITIVIVHRFFNQYFTHHTNQSERLVKRTG